MLNLPAKIITILLLLGILIEYATFPTAKDAAPFHREVATIVDRVPKSFAGWTGEDVPLPAPSLALLGEPIALAREYVASDRGLSGTLVIIHCLDVQDIAGHFPPNCYPASGWSRPNPPEGEDVTVPVGGSELPMKRYEFSRRGVSRFEELVTYDVFLIPGRRAATSMREVYEVASNHLLRPYGASQVQVVLQGGLRREDEARIVEALMQQVAPLSETVGKGPVEHAQ